MLTDFVFRPHHSTTYVDGPMWFQGCKLVGKCLSKQVDDIFMKHRNKNRPSPFPGLMS